MHKNELPHNGIIRKCGQIEKWRSNNAIHHTDCQYSNRIETVQCRLLFGSNTIERFDFESDVI